MCFPETPHTRLGGVRLQPGKEGRAELADTHWNQTKREARRPRTHAQLPCGQRTSPLIVPQTAGELRSGGDGALESHCTESADYARAGGIIYWTCH